MADILSAFGFNGANRSDLGRSDSSDRGAQKRPERHARPARSARITQPSQSAATQTATGQKNTSAENLASDIPLPSSTDVSWNPYKKIIEGRIDNSKDLNVHLSARKAISFFLQSKREDIIIFSLSKLVDSLYALSIDREIKLADSICHQWKQIIDGTKTDNSIVLTDLTPADLNALGLADGKETTLTFAGIPKIDIADEKQHYLYKLVTLDPINAILSNSKATQDAINGAITSLGTIIKEATGNKEFLLVPAALLLADALSRSAATRGTALAIYNRLLGINEGTLPDVLKDLTAASDPKQLSKTKLGRANILAASTKEEEINQALSLFIEVLTDGNTDAFSKESAAVGIAKIFLYDKGKKTSSLEFARKIFDLIIGNPNTATIDSLLPDKIKVLGNGDAVVKALGGLVKSNNQYILALAHFGLSDYNLMTSKPGQAGREASLVANNTATPAFLRALAYNNLGIVSVGNDDPELGSFYFKQALDLLKENPNSSESSIFLARSLFLSQRDFGGMVKAYQQAAEKIWAKCTDVQGAMPAVLDIAEQALKGSGKDFDVLSRSEQGRFLILICLEAGSKELMVPDIFKAAEYLEKARGLFNDWKLEKLSCASDYMFESQLHYDLHNIYVSWPSCARDQAALKELDILERLGQFNDFVARRRALLASNVFGMQFGSAGTSAFIRQNLENGQINFNINEDGVVTDAFLFTDDRKSQGVRLHLGIYSGGNWDASAGFAQTKGPVTTEIGINATSEGQVGIHGRIEKRFDRFLSAGLEGRLALGNYTEYELKAFAHYAKRISKGTVFFANLEIAAGQTAQTAWKEFFSTELPTRVPGWQWVTNGLTSFTRISTHMDVGTGGDPAYFWDKIYWRTQSLTDNNNLPMYLWHVDSMLHTSTKPTESVVIDDDPEAKPAEIQLMKIEKRTVGIPTSGSFRDPNVSGVYYISTSRVSGESFPSVLPQSSDIDKIPFDGLLATQIGSDGEAIPTVPVLVYDEKISKTEQVTSGNKVTTTVTIQAKTETEDWHDSYQLIYEKTSTSLKIYKRDLITGGSPTLIYDGRSVRDGNIAVQRYLRASISAGLERTYRNGIIGVQVHAGGTWYSGSSDATHSPDPNTSVLGFGVYGTHIFSNKVSLGWSLGWDKPGGFNYSVGPSVSLGDAASLDFGVGRNGAFVGLSTKDLTIGYGGGGLGGTINIAKGLGVNFGNGGLGLNLGGILTIGSHGISLVNPLVFLGTSIFTYFAQIKPLRDQRHKLEAMILKETEPLKRALLKHYTDDARIREESSRGCINLGFIKIKGDLVPTTFGNNSGKAYGTIDSEIRAAIADVRDELAKGLDASENTAYLIFNLISANTRLAKANVETAVLLSEICAKYPDTKKSIIALWNNLPAEFKGGNKDMDIMALIEAAKTPPVQPAQVKEDKGEEIESRTIVSRRITELRRRQTVSIRTTESVSVHSEKIVEDAISLLTSAPSVTKDYNIRRISVLLSEMSQEQRDLVAKHLEDNCALQSQKVSYKPRGAEKEVEFTLKEFMEYSFSSSLEVKYNERQTQS